MKKYLSPETMSLQVNAQTIVCASPGPEPAPGRSMSLPNVSKTNGSW